MVDYSENLLLHDHRQDPDSDVVENDQSNLQSMVENQKIHHHMDYHYEVFEMENYVVNENLNHQLNLIPE
jgi:hypothetical protein